MAFQKNLSTGSNKSTQQGEQNENWRAQAFINLYVNVGEGKRKVGSIPLKEAKAFERMLIERLQQEGGLEAFIANLTIDFQLADKEVKASDLGW